LFYRFKSLEKMKKLVFAFAAVVAVSFAACGNKTEQAAPVDTDSIEEIVDSVIDSTAVAVDSAAAAVVDSAATAQ
jgi:hypothetical protein